MCKQFVAGAERRCAVGARAFVDPSQVYVARDEFAEMAEEFLAEYLRHHISALFGGRDWGDGDGAILDMFAKEVMPYVDMFAALHGCGICGNLGSDAVVFIDNTGLLYVDTHGA